MLGMRRRDLHEHGKPVCVPSPWQLRGRHRANGKRHGDEPDPMLELPGGYALPRWRKRENDVCEWNLGSRREFFDGLRREDRLRCRPVRDERRLGHDKPNVRGVPEWQLQHDGQRGELHAVDLLLGWQLRERARDHHEQS